MNQDSRALHYPPQEVKNLHDAVTWFLSVHRTQNSTNQKAVLTRKSK